MKLYRDELADTMRQDLFALLEEAWNVAASNFPEMSHDARATAIREKFEREWDEQESAVELGVRLINRIVFGDILREFFALMRGNVGETESLAQS